MNREAVQVLIVSNSLNIGGAQRFAATLLAGLDRKRVQPHLALLQNDIGYPLPTDVPVYQLDYARAGDLPGSVWKLRRLIRKTQPQVVLGVGTAVNVVIGLSLMVTRRRPAWIAGMDTNPNRRDLRFRTKVLRRLYPLTDALVACSFGMQEALKTTFPREKKKIACIFYPMDFEAMDIAVRERPDWVKKEGPVLLATVGRAYGVKRWDLLLEAVATVSKTKEVALVCCGDGPLLDRLKEKARDLNIREDVHFLGHCSNPFAILAQADLFVLSSEAEGLPYALIEAQALGLCAVSTRCDFGPEEIIEDGETGLLVDVNDTEKLVRALQVLIDNPPLRDRMGSRARDRVRERFDLSKRCAQWEELILRCAPAK